MLRGWGEKQDEGRRRIPASLPRFAREVQNSLFKYGLPLISSAW